MILSKMIRMTNCLETNHLWRMHVFITLTNQSEIWGRLVPIQQLYSECSSVYICFQFLYIVNMHGWCAGTMVWHQSPEALNVRISIALWPNLFGITPWLDHTQRGYDFTVTPWNESDPCNQWLRREKEELKRHNELHEGFRQMIINDRDDPTIQKTFLISYPQEFMAHLPFRRVI